MISYLSIVVFGFILYLVSAKTKRALPVLGAEAAKKSSKLAQGTGSDKGGLPN